MRPFSPIKQICQRRPVEIFKVDELSTSSSFFSCCSLVVLSFCLLSKSRSLSDSFCFFSRTWQLWVWVLIHQNLKFRDCLIQLVIDICQVLSGNLSLKDFFHLPLHLVQLGHMFFLFLLHHEQGIFIGHLETIFRQLRISIFSQTLSVPATPASFLHLKFS